MFTKVVSVFAEETSKVFIISELIAGLQVSVVHDRLISFTDIVVYHSSGVTNKLVNVIDSAHARVHFVVCGEDIEEISDIFFAQRPISNTITFVDENDLLETIRDISESIVLDAVRDKFFDSPEAFQYYLANVISLDIEWKTFRQIVEKVLHESLRAPMRLRNVIKKYINELFSRADKWVMPGDNLTGESYLLMKTGDRINGINSVLFDIMRINSDLLEFREVSFSLLETISGVADTHSELLDNISVGKQNYLFTHNINVQCVSMLMSMSLRFRVGFLLRLCDELIKNNVYDSTAEKAFYCILIRTSAQIRSDTIEDSLVELLIKLRKVKKTLRGEVDAQLLHFLVKTFIII